MTKFLGRLERVELKEAWETEAQDFTPWLAREDNLSLLGDTLGIDLELEAQERHVGPFRADILCKNLSDSLSSESWVLIENQLGRTDHTHLGQLITYASGLHAATIVWIASQITDEHRAALDWLNEITDEKFRFFGLEVELWRIGDSPAAPKFNLVSKPNEWSRAVSQSAKSIDETELSDTRVLQRRFWQGLAEILAERRGPVRPTKPFPQSWYGCSVGRSGFAIVASMHLKDRWIRVELSILSNDAKKYFDILKTQKEDIERGVGTELIWDRMPERKQVRISTELHGTDPANEADWPRQHQWLAEMLEKFHGAFSNRVKSLDVADWRPEAEEEA